MGTLTTGEAWGSGLGESRSRPQEGGWRAQVSPWKNRLWSCQGPASGPTPGPASALQPGVQGAGGAVSRTLLSLLSLLRIGSVGTEEATRNSRALPPFVEGKLRLVGAGVASCPSATAAGGGLGLGLDVLFSALAHLASPLARP